MKPQTGDLTKGESYEYIIPDIINKHFYDLKASVIIFYGVIRFMSFFPSSSSGAFRATPKTNEHRLSLNIFLSDRLNSSKLNRALSSVKLENF